MKFKLCDLGILFTFIMPRMFTGLAVRARKVCERSVVTLLEQRLYFLGIWQGLWLWMDIKKTCLTMSFKLHGQNFLTNSVLRVNRITGHVCSLKESQATSFWPIRTFACQVRFCNLKFMSLCFIALTNQRREFLLCSHDQNCTWSWKIPQ